MLPVCFGPVDEPSSGSVSWALHCLVLVQVALCPLVVFHILNHLSQALFCPVGGEVLYAKVSSYGLPRFAHPLAMV